MNLRLLMVDPREMVVDDIVLEGHKRISLTESKPVYFKLQEQSFDPQTRTYVWNDIPIQELLAQARRA